MNRVSFALRLSAVVALVAATSCAGDMASNEADFGATQGGVQDMGLARELVKNGQVPPTEAFLVEGMFSEHDLPLSGAACQRLLCLRGALGIAPNVDGASAGWVQVGMSSTVNPDTFQRPSLTLVAAVDVSGSMGWDYSTRDNEYPTPGALSRVLLQKLAGQLGPTDRIAIVTYGDDVHTALALTSGDRHDDVNRAIDSLKPDGSTNMEAGLREAFAVARSARGMAQQTRVILFTDAQPNVGATSATEFESMSAAAANDGVGLTVFGLGIGLGQQLLNAVSHLRGGNAFAFSKWTDVEKLMQEHWPWFVSPIAYDLALDVTPATGYRIAEAYGFPRDSSGHTGLSVATVFLSRKKGALLVRIDPSTAGVGLNGLGLAGSLSYSTPEGEAVSESFQLAYGNEPLDARGQFWQQASVAKTTALALFVSGMADAAKTYATDHGAAISRMGQVLERFEADSAALADPALQPEIQLGRDLLALMQRGAPRGDLYGQR